MSKQVSEIAKGKNFTAIDIGSWDGLLDYATGDNKGKLFLKDQMQSTGVEMSFQLLPAGTELPFFHAHKQNEEVYIVLKGKGQVQIDDQTFHVREGSVVRVAPGGNRSLKSADDSEMIYMVVQVKENSLSQWTMTDGVIATQTPKWLN